MLESYVDDVFGGADSQVHGAYLKAQLVKVGKLTTAVMNPLKCKGPSQVLDILGFCFDAVLRRVNLPKKKQIKYRRAIRAALSATVINSKTLEKIIGYLVYASWAEP